MRCRGGACPAPGRSDLFGATVILAARIATQADGGESVLRGFEDPVRLYEVSWQE